MMGGRRLVAAAAVAAVAVVAVVTVRGGSHRPAPPASPTSTEVAGPATDPAATGPQPDAAPSTSAPGTSTTSAAASGAVQQQAAALEAGQGGAERLAPADQWRALLATDAPRAGLYRLIRDPASSDLPPAVAARAATTGSRFVVADVTGMGREAFPGWWGERPPVPEAATARVLVAGAASYGPLVQVVVVWDGTTPGGSALGERTTTVFLDSTSSDVFVPVHPGEVR